MAPIKEWFGLYNVIYKILLKYKEVFNLCNREG